MKNSSCLYCAAVASLFCWAAVLAGCAKSEGRAAGERAAADTVAPATPATSGMISLTDVAGKWRMRRWTHREATWSKLS